MPRIKTRAGRSGVFFFDFIFRNFSIITPRSCKVNFKFPSIGLVKNNGSPVPRRVKILHLSTWTPAYGGVKSESSKAVPKERNFLTIIDQRVYNSIVNFRTSTPCLYQMVIIKK